MTDQDPDDAAMATVTELPTPPTAGVPPRDERDWVTSRELCAEAGITYRQADYWFRTGMLEAEVDNPGNGIPRKIPEAQVTRARVTNDLLRGGVSLQIIRHYIDRILEDGRVDIGAITITHNGITNRKD